MALIVAWTLLFPIFSFLGCFSLCSASTEDNAFHFDIEESSAYGSQDNSLLRGQQQATSNGLYKCPPFESISVGLGRL
uniref:Uncharacterized protein n=1 Tax=Laticauda laticaudata TaxID=8630 RepID=A0A8C5RHT5_LATLA